MTLKDALWRELKYGLCGSGGTLEGLVEQDHVKLDVRIEPDSARPEADYPWILFRVARHEEDDQVRYVKGTVEITLIGLRSSAAKGDTLLEELRTLLIDHFSGKRKTWGKFDADGNADPSGGLRMGCAYRDTVEAVDDTLNEKLYVLVMDFAYARE